VIGYIFGLLVIYFGHGAHGMPALSALSSSKGSGRVTAADPALGMDLGAVALSVAMLMGMNKR